MAASLCLHFRRAILRSITTSQSFRLPGILPNCQKTRSQSSTAHDDDPGAEVAGYQATSLSILNQEEDESLLVDSYSQLGFLLNNGIRVFGPIALFPRSVLHWNIAGPEAINCESLSLFCLLEPKIDILVLGVGDKGTRIDHEVIRFLKSKHINVEILPTDQACSTFNFLNAEQRYVAAGLLPPSYVSLVREDPYYDLEESPHRDPFLLDSWSEGQAPGDRILEHVPEKTKAFWKKHLGTGEDAETEEEAREFVRDPTAGSWHLGDGQGPIQDMPPEPRGPPIEMRRAPTPGVGVPDSREKSGEGDEKKGDR